MRGEGVARRGQKPLGRRQERAFFPPFLWRSKERGRRGGGGAQPPRTGGGIPGVPHCGVGKTPVNDAARAQYCDTTRAVSRRGTPRRYKRQRARQGRHSGVGGQLSARPYSIAPTKSAMANLPYFLHPADTHCGAVPDLETLRSWWMAALRRGRPKVACPFSPPRLRIFPSCCLFLLPAYHLCPHSCLSILYIPAHLPILLACASSLHATYSPSPPTIFAPISAYLFSIFLPICLYSSPAHLPFMLLFPLHAYHLCPIPTYLFSIPAYLPFSICLPPTLAPSPSAIHLPAYPHH